MNIERLQEAMMILQQEFNFMDKINIEITTTEKKALEFSDCIREEAIKVSAHAIIVGQPEAIEGMFASYSRLNNSLIVKIKE